MKLFANRLVSSKCTGIYIGPDAVIGVTSTRRLRSWNVESISSQINSENEESSVTTDANIVAIKDNLNDLLRKNSNTGTIQIALDDRYVRFFVLPLSEKPGQKEIEGILRWQAEKFLQNPKDYEYSAQLIETRSGFRIYGAAVSKEVMNTIDDVLQSHNLSWYLADSAASYIWNSFDEQYRQGAIVHISLGRYGWTLIACNTNGIIEMIKPGRWSYDIEGIPQIRKGMIEAHRLLTTYVDKNPQERPERVYVDAGVMYAGVEHAREFFGEDLVMESPATMSSFPTQDVPEEYSHELSIAMKASLPR